MELGLGKPPPKLKLLQLTQLTQIPALKCQKPLVENVAVGDYRLFIFIVCFEK